MNEINTTAGEPLFPEQLNIGNEIEALINEGVDKLEAVITVALKHHTITDAEASALRTCEGKNLELMSKAQGW